MKTVTLQTNVNFSSNPLFFTYFPFMAQLFHSYLHFSSLLYHPLPFSHIRTMHLVQFERKKLPNLAAAENQIEHLSPQINKDSDKA